MVVFSFNKTSGFQCCCANLKRMSSSSDTENLESTNDDHSNVRVYCVGELYKTEIFKAIVANDLNKVKELLASTNCLSAQDNNGHTPLHLAVITNNKEILELLLQQQGIDVDALNYPGESPLFLSLLLKRDENFVLQIINANCNVSISNKIKETPLHLAARYGYTFVGEALIKRGANVNARDSSGFTPLHEACSYSHLEFVRLLLRYDADTSIKCDSHLTPFMMAVNNTDNPAIALELIGIEHRLNNITVDGYSTLLLAINSFNPIAYELIESGADVNHCPPDGRCALQLALFWKDSKLYHKIFPKFDKHLLNVKFMVSLFTKCQFPGDEWGLCTIDLLKYDLSGIFRKYFKRHPNSWKLTSIKNIPPAIRVELIDRFLSLNVPVTVNDAFEVYSKYGFGEELEVVLKRNIRYQTYRSVTNRPYEEIYLCPVLFGAVFLHEDLKALVYAYLHIINRRRTIKLNANILKFVEMSHFRVPSLVELSRNASRVFIYNSCLNRDSLTSHKFLNSLMVPQIIKDIIKLKVPVYRFNC